MNNRQQELAKLKEYIENIDKETTLLLQNLQWDHKHLLGSTAMVSCQYVASHRIPLGTKEAHEKRCYLAQHGYSKEDVLLPDPIDPDADTVVKFSKQDIMQIINAAASSNPSFKTAAPGPEPLSAARLQLAYSASERRALHDAVVAAAPACHDLADLALPSSSNEPQTSKVKSRVEILAELRDMKRRRTKYRVAAKTGNYSDVLRDVIKTQMELYAEAKGIFIKTEYGSKTYISLNRPPEQPNRYSPILVKLERISPEGDNYNEDSRRKRERSRSKDKRTRRERDEQETASKNRRDGHDNKEDYSDKNRSKDSSQDRDKYTAKERRRYDDYQAKRDKVYKTKEEVDTFHDRNRQSDNRKDYTQKSNSFKDSHRYDGSGRKRSKHESYYGDSSKNIAKYDAGSSDKYDRSYKEDSSKNNKYDYRRRRDEEYYKTNKKSDKYDIYDDYIERKKRKRLS